MYIVTSKPKRMSEYSGLVHIVITFYKLFFKSDLVLGTYASQTTPLENKLLEENSAFSLRILLRPLTNHFELPTVLIPPN